jgi:hypothetical protein
MVVRLHRSGLRECRFHFAFLSLVRDSWPQQADATGLPDLSWRNINPASEIVQRMRKELERIREWAAAQLTTGAEPLWSWHQLMRLQATIGAILSDMDSVTTESSSLSEERLRGHLRLVASNGLQDIAPPRSVGLSLVSK